MRLAIAAGGQRRRRWRFASPHPAGPPRPRYLWAPSAPRSCAPPATSSSPGRRHPLRAPPNRARRRYGNGQPSPPASQAPYPLPLPGVRANGSCRACRRACRTERRRRHRHRLTASRPPAAQGARRGTCAPWWRSCTARWRGASGGPARRRPRWRASPAAAGAARPRESSSAATTSASAAASAPAPRASPCRAAGARGSGPWTSPRRRRRAPAATPAACSARS
mmetsp:Transcript_89396/g.250155  ORF Transcript_89396/g.250155 Transcript_89396/m.250155 type:complete len:223 (+) Transcript_89396:459-1127(+)